MRVGITPKLARAKELALEKMTMWSLTQKGWVFRFNNRKRGMGLCVFPKIQQGREGRIELSRHLVERNDEAEVLDTILHEIAHALAGHKAGHGPVWRSWCGIVGANPQRCGNADMPAGKWQATCPGCSKVYHRHRKPKYVTGYYCRLCGKERGQLSFLLVV